MSGTLKTIGAAQLRKLKPYGSYKASGLEWLGHIPADWGSRPLKYFVSAPLAYGVLKPDKYTGTDGVRLIRILDVESGEVREGSLEVISPDQSREFSRTIVQAGDVVVSVVGTIGRAFVVPQSLEGSNLSRALARVQLKRTLLPTFLEYCFESHSFVSFVDRISTGTAQRVLNLSDLGNFSLAVPSESEQQIIVEFLDRETAKIDALAVKKQQLIELLQEKRAALITRAVTVGLDQNVPMKESGVTELRRIPAHWQVTHLKHAARILDWKHRTVPFVVDGIPVASIREVQSWEVDLTQAKMTTEQEHLLMVEGGRDPRPGDVIVSRNATVGAAALVPDKRKFCMGQDVSLVRPNTYLEPTYLNWLFRSDRVINQISSASIGSTFFRINVEQIKELFIELPPVEEQRAINAYIAAAIGKIDRLRYATERTIALLTESRTALISAAVTGKIDLREEVG